MEWNLKTALILIGILIVGYGIGLLEMYLRQSKKVKSLEEKLRIQEQQQSIAEAASPPAPPGALRLWFDGTQTANLEVDGTPLTSPQAVTAEQRRRLIALLGQLRPWVEGGSAVPAPAPKAVSFAAPGLSVPQAPEKARKDEAAKPPPPTSIVGQIDEILQKNITGTPLAGKVRLAEGVGGSVEVWVGLKRYSAIDEVPEAEIKAAIRAAIAEWEQRA
jgi:hypothetical protein